MSEVGPQFLPPLDWTDRSQPCWWHSKSRDATGSISTIPRRAIPALVISPPCFLAAPAEPIPALLSYELPTRGLGRPA